MPVVSNTIRGINSFLMPSNALCIALGIGPFSLVMSVAINSLLVIRVPVTDKMQAGKTDYWYLHLNRDMTKDVGIAKAQISLGIDMQFKAS